MINRRVLLSALAGGTLAAPFEASAQAADKVWKIGTMSTLPPGATLTAQQIQPFTQSLRESGFVEGKNIVIERRATGGRPDLAAQAAAELIGLHVDVLLVGATPNTRAAKAATKTVPIVMWLVSDPVERGLVVSLARPEGNLTGVADFGTSLLPKQMELLKVAAPKISRVAFVGEESGRFYSAEMAESLNQQYDAAARRLGIEQGQRCDEFAAGPCQRYEQDLARGCRRPFARRKSDQFCLGEGTERICHRPSTAHGRRYLRGLSRPADLVWFRLL
jgi:putative ABC transport system substrate-binding protein